LGLILNIYPSPGGGGNMFKDLPPAYIGKLVTHFSKELVMPQDEENERVISYHLLSVGKLPLVTVKYRYK
jgi:hypothetical protein